jgi:adenosylmethionine-8-amino-7-oxononanoate aminotransferase
MGHYLLSRLHELLNLPMVGDVRGLGLLAGVEFVKNKTDKTPFDPSLGVNAKVIAGAFDNGLIIYPGSGGTNGVEGDHVLIAPPFIIEKEEIDEMVDILAESIEKTVRQIP